MNVLVVGGGAREHVICDAVTRSENVNLFSVMKNLNPGIEKMAVEYLLEKETNIDQVVNYAKEKKIDLVLVGPEAPLELGLVNALQKHGIKACAPTKEAARIETDKEWMRNLLKKYNISGQLKYETFTDADKAREFIDKMNAEVAIKPIGLTGGKGVQVSGDHFNGTAEAMNYVNKVIDNKIGGAAKVLIEEKAIGEEFTVQAFSDGAHILTLPAVQDHKRLLPNDKGPNCYSKDTEILTEQGWKRFDSVTLDEKVAVVNPKSRELWFEEPLKKYWMNYEGKMFQFKNRNIDLLVTPNHRMFVQQRKGSKRKYVVEAKQYQGENYLYQSALWTGKNPDYFILPEYNYGLNRKFKSLKIDFKDWVKFLGIYLAEGYATKKQTKRVYICQTMKSKNLNKMKKIISKLPFNFTYENSNNKFRINSTQLGTYLMQFGTSHNKYVPNYIKNAKIDIILDFLKAFNLGDGDIHHGKMRFCSSSKRLIDDIQEMIIKLDHSGIITVDKRKTMINPINKKKYRASPIYSIEMKKRNKTSIRKYNIDTIDYNGLIGCVSVSTGFLMVRRNNRVAICGNTGGMGSYSCSNGLLPFLCRKDYDQGVRILRQIIDALDKEGCTYIGPIYGQFMLTVDGAKIIEINARFGDPENMNVLPLLKTDFIELCNAMLKGELREKKLDVEKKSTVCKYVVPEGYGLKSMVGEKITVDENPIIDSGAKLFYASVDKKNSDIFTSSSRSLAVVGIADELENAEKICEKALTYVKGDHIFIRHDIGTKDLIEKRIDHMNELRGK